MTQHIYIFCFTSENLYTLCTSDQFKLKWAGSGGGLRLLINLIISEIISNLAKMWGARDEVTLLQNFSLQASY